MLEVRGYDPGMFRSGQVSVQCITCLKSLIVRNSLGRNSSKWCHNSESIWMMHMKGTSILRHPHIRTYTSHIIKQSYLLQCGVRSMKLICFPSCMVRPEDCDTRWSICILQQPEIAWFILEGSPQSTFWDTGNIAPYHRNLPLACESKQRDPSNLAVLPSKGTFPVSFYHQAA